MISRSALDKLAHLVSIRVTMDNVAPDQGEALTVADWDTKLPWPSAVDRPNTHVTDPEARSNVSGFFLLADCPTS